MIIEAAHLSGALEAVKNAVDRSGRIPILQTCLVEAAGGKLSVTGTDLDLRATAAAPCSGDLEPVCIPLWLLEAGARLKGAEIGLKIERTRATLFSGRAKFHGDVLPKIDFPGWEPECQAAAKIVGSDLARALSVVKSTISTETTRFYLCGAFLETIEGSLIATATDGLRLLSYSLPCDFEIEPVIVPTYAVDELIRMGQGAGEAIVDIQFGAHAVAASFGDWRIVSKVIEGSFPDWRRIVPETTGKAVLVDAGDATAALSRVIRAVSDSRAAGRQKGGTTAIAVVPVCDGLSLIAENVAEDFIPAEVSGICAFGVSAPYLRDALQAFATAGVETVEIDCADPGAPLRLLSKNAPLTSVVMPMRVHLPSVNKLEEAA